MSTQTNIPDSHLLTVKEVVKFIKAEFGVEYSEWSLRNMAINQTLPFFKMNDNLKTAKYFIKAGDLRKHIWSQRNKAVNAIDRKAAA